MEISFCSYPNTKKVIATIFGTWHDSWAVVACAKFCRNIIISNWIRAKWNFHRIWIVMEKSLVKWVPGLLLFPHFEEAVWFTQFTQFDINHMVQLVPTYIEFAIIVIHFIENVWFNYCYLILKKYFTSVSVASFPISHMVQSMLTHCTVDAWLTHFIEIVWFNYCYIILLKLYHTYASVNVNLFHKSQMVQLMSTHFIEAVSYSHCHSFHRNHMVQ